MFKVGRVNSKSQLWTMLGSLKFSSNLHLTCLNNLCQYCHARVILHSVMELYNVCVQAQGLYSALEHATALI